MSKIEINPVPAGFFGVIRGDREAIKDDELDWTSRTGRALSAKLNHGIAEVEWEAQSYWASLAEKALLKSVARKIHGKKTILVTTPSFKEPIEERGNRRYHVSVAGPISEINRFKSSVKDLTEKTVGTKQPKTLNELYIKSKVRLLARLTTR